MLVLNGSNLLTARVRLTGASSILCSPRTSFGLFSRGSTLLATVQGISKSASIPHGLRGGVAMAPAISDGGLACYITGIGATVADLRATGNINGTITSSGTVSFGNLAGGKNISSTITGTGTVSNAPLPAFGNLTCSISIGARPSATDIAQAVWEELLTGHTTSGTAAKVLKDKLSRNDYIGLS